MEISKLAKDAKQKGDCVCKDIWVRKFSSEEDYGNFTGP